MKVFNLYGDEWDRTEDRPGWRSKDAWVGAARRAHRRRADRREHVRARARRPALAIPVHHANEEWLLVVRGRPTLRTPEGERVLEEGDVAAFARGEDGAHQVSNRTDAPIRVLMLSTLIVPDFVHYPDSGKFGARSAKGERVLLCGPARSSTTGTEKSDPIWLDCTSRVRR